MKCRDELNQEKILITSVEMIVNLQPSGLSFIRFLVAPLRFDPKQKYISASVP